MTKLVPIASSCVDLIGSIKDLAVDPEDDLLSTEPEGDVQS